MANWPTSAEVFEAGNSTPIFGKNIGSGVHVTEDGAT
jgi:hypothetical protein